MNHGQNQKSVISIADAAGVASGATHSVAIDTIGFDALSVDVVYRSQANTAAPAVVTLKHSDTDGSYGTISGLVQGTDFSVGTVVTNVANVTRFEVNTRPLKRYVQVAVTPAAGSAGATNNDVVVAARLGRAEAGIDSASESGATTRVVG